MTKVPQKAHAYFPRDWDFGDNPSDGNGGEVPLDPVCLYVEIPEQYDEAGNEIYLRTSVRDCVAYSLEDFLVKGQIAPEHVRSLTAIRDGLAECAEMITARLSQKQVDTTP